MQNTVVLFLLRQTVHLQNCVYRTFSIIVRCAYLFESCSFAVGLACLSCLGLGSNAASVMLGLSRLGKARLLRTNTPWKTGCSMHALLYEFAAQMAYRIVRIVLEKHWQRCKLCRVLCFVLNC
jgi:hypothetical protein